MNRERARPRSHHVALDEILVAVRIAILDRTREVRVAAPVGTCRHLLKASFVKPVIRLDVLAAVTHLCRIEGGSIVPVGLKNALGHALEELVLVVPDVVAPDPGTAPRLLGDLGEPKEVMPPQIALTADGEKMAALMVGGFLIVSEVEVARIIEHLCDILDEILAHLIILLCGNHAMVVLKPCVVASGEVELRNHLKTHSTQTGDFLAELLNAPGALHGELRMAGILNDLGEVDDDLVAASLCESGGKALPGRFIETDMVCAAARKPLFGHGRILRLKRNILPGVDSEMRKVRPDELRLRILDDGCRCGTSAERKCACCGRNEFASINSHIASLWLLGS